MVLVGRRSTNTYVAASFGCLLREDAKHKGEQFTPYSVRHRYAKGRLVAYVSIANISEAMGHTIEVHLTSYARFKPDATADLVEAVNA